LCVLAPVFRIAGEAVLILLIVLALIIWKPYAGCLLCGAFLFLSVLYICLVKKRLRRYGMEELEARRKQSRTVVEAFCGYAELEIAQAFYTSLASFNQGLDSIIGNRLRMEVYQLFPSFLSEVAIVIGLALLIGTGSGDLGLISGVFAVAAFRLIPAVRSVLNSWVTLQNASHTITVVEEGITVISDELPKNLPSESLLEFTHTLELRGLEFAFPDGHTLFSGLDLVV
ncbi:ABC transporter ATP-binding protein, partial [Bacteroides intestinalis]|nr:ABC transporter ATP-binding protein [Bacteroides intestinalis]